MSLQATLYRFADDGETPNNAVLPLLYFPDVCAEAGRPRADAPAWLARLADSGWHGGWINGIYPFHHYHARSHEVLVNLGDDVRVQFGGRSGESILFEAGAGVVIPAGVGHCRLSCPSHIAIVGAYPSGQEDWDLKRSDRPEDYRMAAHEVPAVALPASDPFTGDGEGPVLAHWGVGRS